MEINHVDQSPDVRSNLHDIFHGQHGPPHKVLFKRGALLEKAKTTRSVTSIEIPSRTVLSSNTAIGSTRVFYPSTTAMPAAIESTVPILLPTQTVSNFSTVTIPSTTLAPIVQPASSPQRVVPITTFIAVIAAICFLVLLLAGILFWHVYHRRYENRKFPVGDGDQSDSRDQKASRLRTGATLQKWKKAFMPARPANIEISPVQRDNKGRNMIQVTKSVVSTINPLRSVYVDSYYIRNSSAPSFNTEILNPSLKAQQELTNASPSVSTAIQILPPLQTGTRSRQHSTERTLETEGERILKQFGIHQHDHGVIPRTDSPYTDVSEESGIRFASATPSVIAPRASRGSIDLRRLSASLDEEFTPHDEAEDLTLPGMERTPSPLPPFDVDDATPCSLCKTRFQNTDMVIELPCTHVHHAKCLKEWFTSVAATCPHCRRNYSNVEINDDSQKLAVCPTDSERRQSQLESVASARPFRLNEFVPALRKQMAPSNTTSRTTSIASTARHNQIGTAF